MFKVGDIVRPTKDSPYGPDSGSAWAYPGKVESTSAAGSVIRMLEGPMKGREGGFHIKDLELVDVNKPLSDQELADKYRVLRKEALEISTELKNRGYTMKYSYLKGGVESYVHDDVVFSIIKTETKEVIL